MSTAMKLSAYGVALALVAGGGWTLGAAVGPLAGEAGTLGTTSSEGPPSTPDPAHGESDGGGHG